MWWHGAARSPPRNQGRKQGSSEREREMVGKRVDVTRRHMSVVEGAMAGQQPCMP